MKRKQVQLFCGRFISTTSQTLPDGLTMEIVKQVVGDFKKIESLDKWFLIDCKQNVQAFTDDQSVNISQQAIFQDMLQKELKKQRSKPVKTF